MTQKEILEIALAQSASDSNCAPKDFLSEKNKIVFSEKRAEARRYLKLPFLCDFVSYGHNIVASVSPQYYGVAAEYISRFPPEHCFETPALHVLDELLNPLRARVCFMAEYWLPDLSHLKPLSCPYPTRLLCPDDFCGLYLPEWSNALCEKRKGLDILGIGAYDAGKLIGLAGASADCPNMWQIGIDVLPEYRNRGVASALTSALAVEILRRNKVPFYCCAWSNLASARNAMRSGFSPAWVQMTVKSESDINELNRRVSP